MGGASGILLSRVDMVDLGRPCCPACERPLRRRMVRKLRYFHCDCEGSRGEGEAASAPQCNLCGEEMSRTLGLFGPWKGRWFWSCPVHVVPNATVKSPPGPAEPRTLHRREPVIGGGFARRGL